MFFAVIQEGHRVYGVGRNEAEAIADASRLGPPTAISAALVLPEFACHGDIFLVPCTQALFNRVSKYGPEDIYQFTEHGTADVIAEPFGNELLWVA